MRRRQTGTCQSTPHNRSHSRVPNTLKKRRRNHLEQSLILRTPLVIRQNTGRRIQNNRRLIPGRNRKTYWRIAKIAEKRPPAIPLCIALLPALHAKTNTPRLGTHPRIMTRRTNMPHMPRQPHTHTQLSRFANRVLCRAHHRKIPHRTIAINNSTRRRLLDHPHIGTRIETPIFKTLAIAINRARTVAANTSQIAIDQQAADNPRVICLKPRLFKTSRGKIQKAIFIDANKRFRRLVHKNNPKVKSERTTSKTTNKPRDRPQTYR